MVKPECKHSLFLPSYSKYLLGAWHFAFCGRTRTVWEFWNQEIFLNDILKTFKRLHILTLKKLIKQEGKYFNPWVKNNVGTFTQKLLKTLKLYSDLKNCLDTKFKDRGSTWESNRIVIIKKFKIKWLMAKKKKKLGYISDKTNLLKAFGIYFHLECFTGNHRYLKVLNSPVLVFSPNYLLFFTPLQF